MNNLYEKIEHLCSEHGITPGKLCSEIGVRRSVLSDLKTGRKKGLSFDTLSRIANYFHISLDTLQENHLDTNEDANSISHAVSSGNDNTVFYDLYCELCKAKGVTPTRAATEMGLSKSTPTAWKKKGITPQAAQLQKIADYFHVSVDYLCGNKEKSLDSEDQELNEYLEMLRTRPEMKMMFQLAKGATKEDVEKAVRVIEAMLGKDSKGD